MTRVKDIIKNIRAIEELCSSLTSEEQNLLKVYKSSLIPLEKIQKGLRNLVTENYNLGREDERRLSENPSHQTVVQNIKGTVITDNSKVNTNLLEENRELKENIQWFVDRCEKGEVKSEQTYVVYKSLLKRLSLNSPSEEPYASIKPQTQNGRDEGSHNPPPVLDFNPVTWQEESWGNAWGKWCTSEEGQQIYKSDNIPFWA